MKKATSDPSKRLDIYLRIARNGSITFTFLNSAGAAYTVSDLDFELFIKQNSGSRKDVISLLTSYAGFGLTFPTANTLKATFTDTITEINEGEYYWELLVLDTNKTWLCGKAFFHNGEFDGVDSSTGITISDSGQTIEISITETTIPTITLSGDVTGSGTTSIATELAADTVGLNELSATGTPDNTKFLRGDNAWAVPASGGTLIYEAKIAVSSADILNIKSSPKKLLDAPGAGFFINILTLVYDYNFVTSAYSTDVNGIVYYGTYNNENFDQVSGLLSRTADQMIISQCPTSQRIFVRSLSSYVENKDVYLSTTTSNPTGGDSTLNVYIRYIISSI